MSLRLFQALTWVQLEAWLLRSNTINYTASSDIWVNSPRVRCGVRYLYYGLALLPSARRKIWYHEVCSRAVVVLASSLVAHVHRSRTDYIVTKLINYSITRGIITSWVVWTFVHAVLSLYSLTWKCCTSSRACSRKYHHIIPKETS